MSSLVLNNQLRYQGSAAYAMVGIVVGAVINIGLDPVLIFGCNMGVAGAGLATVISQFISFCLLYAGCRRGGNISISIRRVKCKASYFSHIIQGGLPSLARQGLASISAICLNLAAGPFLDAAIAAMSNVTRVMQICNSAIIGFGQGFQPVCGFNYGAKKYGRVKAAFWFSVKVCTAVLLVTALLKNALKNKYVQAVLRGLKPCVIGIVLATGVYMVLGNCFGTVTAITVNVQALVITVLLVASMFGYKYFAKKKLSPILLIVISAIAGIVIYGI